MKKLKPQPETNVSVARPKTVHVAVLRYVGIVAKNLQETSKLTIFSEYGEALQGLATFSHIVVFYWLHRRDTEDDRRILRVNPKRHLGAPELGVFATRSPVRPNPIAFEVCRLVEIEGCNLYVKESDAYEGTPIIDIKPYMPRADAVPNAQTPSWAAQGPKT